MPLLEFAHRRKLQWFGHTTRRVGLLAYDVMHGLVEGARGQGRPNRTWLTDIARRTGIGTTACVRLAEMLNDSYIIEVHQKRTKGYENDLDLTLSDYGSIVAQPFLVSPHDWLALRPDGNYCHLHVNDQSLLPSTIW